jgi:transposase InsO family protein
MVRSRRHCSRHSSSSDEAVGRRPREKYRRERRVSRERPGQSRDGHTRQEQTRLQRLESLVEDLLRQKETPANRTPDVSGNENRQIKYITKTDCIPEFMPGNPNMTMSRWIFKIDQLGEVHGWDDVERTYHMQNGLRGLAKSWYDSLTTINYTWQQWKELLMKAFPEHTDYASCLHKMLNRTKLPNESMATYYYNKLEALQICKITGKDAVSCVIDGLHSTALQNGARAGRYETPESLYEEYLSRISDERQPEKRKMDDEPTRLNVERGKVHRGERLQRKVHDQRNRKVRCFNCSLEGHLANNCSRPRLSCKRCNRLGHSTENCRRTEKSGSALTISTTNETQQIYFVDCRVNKTPMRGYVDPGSSVVLIKEDAAKRLQLEMKHSDAVIKGFGGSETAVIGEVNIDLNIDEVEVKVPALVVPNAVQEIPILIGQPFVNHEGVMVVIRGETLTVVPEQALPILEGISPTKIAVWAKEATVIPAKHIAHVEVDTHPGDEERTIFIEAACRHYGNQLHLIPSGILTTKQSHIPIINLGNDDIHYKRGQVIARGEVCCEENDPTNVSTVLHLHAARNPITLDEIKVDYSTPPEVKDQLCKLLNQYRECFAQNYSELGQTDLTKMSIQLNSDKPVVYRPYRLAHTEREKVRKIIDELKENKIIRDSYSSYASPILLVRKKTGEDRLCIDFRALNKITVKDKYPIPRIEDQIDRLLGAKLFTSLDMASGYYQINMADSSIQKTAFVTPDGHFEFLRMPFGLVNAPAVFQRLVHEVLGPLRFTSTLVYMDDLLLPTASYDAGLKDLEKVLKVLRDAHLTLRLSKCSFFQTKVDYLGHEISAEGVRPGSAKIKAVQDFKTPQNVREVRQFLGLTSFFRKYIPNFAQLAKPLTMLTCKGADFVWESRQDRAFQELKARLTERPLLAIYSVDAETEVHTDASKTGLGGILFQKQEGNWKPIAYFSRQTTKEEQRYHSYELETLAVVQTLKKFRTYLIGIKFRVVTDCNALRTAFTKKDILPRVGRWWLTLQEFDFEVVYRPGAKMLHVDALSRNPVEKPVGLEDIDVFTINVSEDDWVLAAQLQDERLKYVREVLLRTPQDGEEEKIHGDFVLRNNRVFRKTVEGLRWAVPKTARRQLTMLNHDTKGHFSLEKTLGLMKQSYWFPGMRQYVKRYIKGCLGCLYNKEPAGKRPGFLFPIEKVGVPMHTLHLDHLGPFVKSRRKNAYLIVAVDAFTKFIIMKAVPNTKTTHVEKFLKERIIEIFGVPKRLVTDRGTCFTSERFKQTCKRLGTKHILNATATPRANGQVERYNRTLLASIAATFSDEETWDHEISKVAWGLNTTINKATGESPFKLMFGYVPRSMHDAFLANEVDTDQYDKNVNKTRSEVEERLQLAGQCAKSRHDKKRCVPKTFHEGELVVVRKVRTTNEGSSKKLLPKYEGPFKIQRVLPHDRYVVSDLEGSRRSQRAYSGVHSVDKLKHYEACQSDDSDATDVEYEK